MVTIIEIYSVKPRPNDSAALDHQADPLQSVCHGDAKGANIVYATDVDGGAVPLELAWAHLSR